VSAALIPDPASRGGAYALVLQPAECGEALLTALGAVARAWHAHAFAIGPQHEAERAQQAGVPVVASCAPPLGRPALGWRTLLREARPHLMGRATLGVGAASAALAAALAPRTVALEVEASMEPGDHALLERARRRGRAPEWTPMAAVATTAVSLDREDLRRRWRVAPGTHVVALVAAPAWRGDAWTALDMVGRVALAGTSVALVVQPDASSLSRARRLASAMPGLEHVIATDLALQPARMASALDAALVTHASESASVVLDAVALAHAGVPVVAPEGSATAAALQLPVEHRGQGGRPTAMAAALGRVLHEPHAAAAMQRPGLRHLETLESLADRLRARLDSRSVTLAGLA
jgi:hypothetical protein